MGHIHLASRGDHLHETMLVKAWTQMAEGGDLERLWFPQGKTISQALECWLGNLTYIAFDESGIWGISWFEEWMGHQGIWSFWLRPDCRRTKKGRELCLDMVERGKAIFQSVLTFTDNPKMLSLWKKLGFELKGELEVGSKPCWIGQLKGG